MADSKLVRYMELVRDLQDNPMEGASGISTADFLPQICVVGSQSDGKSTLLSAVASAFMPGDIKFEFLPTATDICTRCPITVQMMKKPPGARDPDTHEAWVYAAGPGTKPTRSIPGPVGMEDTEEFVATLEEFGRTIAMNIGAVQNQLCGEGTEVHDKPITVRLAGPCMPDLTLVDLPGLIEQSRKDPRRRGQIEALVTKKIKPSASILLCVIKATDHLDNCKGMTLARKVDASLGRTVCAFTKTDMIFSADGRHGREERALQKAIADTIQDEAPESVFVTYNPSAEDIRDGLFDESQITDFFRHAPDQVGNRALTKALERRLATHVHDQLPKQLDTFMDRLGALNTQLGGGRVSSWMKVEDLVRTFARTCHEVAGEAGEAPKDVRKINRSEKFHFASRNDETAKFKDALLDTCGGDPSGYSELRLLEEPKLADAELSQGAEEVLARVKKLKEVRDGSSKLVILPDHKVAWQMARELRDMLELTPEAIGGQIDSRVIPMCMELYSRVANCQFTIGRDGETKEQVTIANDCPKLWETMQGKLLKTITKQGEAIKDKLDDGAVVMGQEEFERYFLTIEDTQALIKDLVTMEQERMGPRPGPEPLMVAPAEAPPVAPVDPDAGLKAKIADLQGAGAGHGSPPADFAEKEGSMFGFWDRRFCKMIPKADEGNDCMLSVFNSEHELGKARSSSLSSLSGASVSFQNPLNKAATGPFELLIFRPDFKPQTFKLRFQSKNTRDHFYDATTNVSEDRPWFQSREQAEELRKFREELSRSARKQEEDALARERDADIRAAAADLGDLEPEPAEELEEDDEHSGEGMLTRTLTKKTTSKLGEYFGKRRFKPEDAGKQLVEVLPFSHPFRAFLGELTQGKIDDERVIDDEVRAEAFRMYALKFASKTVMDTVANAGKTIQSKFDVNADAGSPFASWGIIQAVDVMKLRDDAVKRGEDDKKASEYLSRSAADEAQRARWEAEKDWTEKMVKKMQAAGVDPSY